jgi:arylsulfatase A-like enzyme
MIVSWPGTTKPGTRTGNPIIIEDLFPSFLAMTGVPAPDGQVIDGHSFVPTLRNPASPSRRPPLVWHYPNLYDQPPYSAIRQGDWKLIYWHATRKRELFNLQDDIGEKDNLAAKNPEKCQALAIALGNHLRKLKADMPVDKGTGDPVPMPDTAP